jgi:hypothetical protein
MEGVRCNTLVFLLCTATDCSSRIKHASFYSTVVVGVCCDNANANTQHLQWRMCGSINCIIQHTRSEQP